MAQKFVSPGVFTSEEDLSFLAEGVAGIGAATIGRTAKGPAFVPTVVNGMDAFASVFGNPDTDLLVPYGAQNYLKNSNALTIVRVLGHDDGTSVVNGYQVSSSAIIDSASNGSALAVLHHIQSVSVAGVALSSTDFTITVGSLFAATASFVPTAANYIGKVLNTDPTLFDTYGHYLYRLPKYASPAASASWGSTLITGSLVSFQRNFEGGSTPWIKSQPIGGLDFNLFKLHTLSHGKATNDDIKVMIANVKPSASPTASPYGTFDIVVREFEDTDQRAVVLETFVGLTLDPESPNFISRVIGDRVDTFDTTQRKFISSGNFENKSRHIRVELATTVNAPAEALPWGFRGYSKEKFVSLATLQDLPLVPNQKDKNGSVDANIGWGVLFLSGGIGDMMKAMPNGASSYLDDDTDFSLANLSASYVNGKQVWTYVAGLSAASQYKDPIFASASLHKFSMPFQGGFDGWDLRTVDPLHLANSADDTNIGVVSLKRALDTIANPDAFDMNILAMHGVHNLVVTNRARQIVNDRGDTLFIMDVTGSTVPEVVGLLKAREIDDNYTACYYPDVVMDDKVNNVMVRVPPSVPMMGAISFSDRVGHPWFAPAGLNRGGLKQFNVKSVCDKLTLAERNDLYDARINPIASFPAEGIVVLGQKTLQIKASALDRINVRRLLIFAKKTIASAAKYLLFEPNNSATWQRFVNTVNPILENVRQEQGLERFKVVMDGSLNTPDVIDRNRMVGKIFLKPTRAAEFIDLSFVITSSGVSFEE